MRFLLERLDKLDEAPAVHGEKVVFDAFAVNERTGNRRRIDSFRLTIIDDEDGPASSVDIDEAALKQAKAYYHGRLKSGETIAVERHKPPPQQAAQRPSYKINELGGGFAGLGDKTVNAKLYDAIREWLKGRKTVALPTSSAATIVQRTLSGLAIGDNFDKGIVSEHVFRADDEAHAARVVKAGAEKFGLLTTISPTNKSPVAHKGRVLLYNDGDNVVLVHVQTTAQVVVTEEEEEEASRPLPDDLDPRAIFRAVMKDKSHKVGDVIMLDGKAYEILRIEPDGAWYLPVDEDLGDDDMAEYKGKKKKGKKKPAADGFDPPAGWDIGKHRKKD